MNEFSIISLGFEKIINKYQNLLNHDLFDKSNMKDYTYIYTYFDKSNMKDYTYIHIYIHTYIHIYIHTYIYIYKQ